MTVCSPKYSPVSCKYLPCPGAGAFTVVHVHGTVTDNRPFLLLSIVFKYANPGFTQHGWQKRERDRIVNKRMGGKKKIPLIFIALRSFRQSSCLISKIFLSKLQPRYSSVSIEFKTKEKILERGLLFDFEERRERKKEKVVAGQKTGRYSRDYGNSYRKEAGGGRRNIPRKYRRYKSYPFDGVGF